MADMNMIVKGYDHQFVDSPPDELLCLICMLVARDPQQSTCCGKVYCKSCVEELRAKHSTNCPQCRGRMNCFPDKRSERNIKSLKVKCDNFQSGCEWIGDLGAIDKHLTDCGFVLIPCPNECSYGSAATSVVVDHDKVFHTLRKDMKKHVSKECPRREFQCPLCSESGEYHEMTTTHLEDCDYVEIPCPNDGCKKFIQRILILSHRSKCDFELRHCRYANIGCNIRVLRKDLEKHENDSELHLKCAIDKVSELDQSVRELTVQERKDIAKLKEIIQKQENVLARLESVIASQSDQICELTSKLDSIAEHCDPQGEHKILMMPADTSQSYCQVFKFTNFAQLKSSKDSLYSPPFYTSPGGYKMCFRVHPNGCRNGEGSHVSVFTYLMRGENDDNLSWPFTGKVKIELLNQLKDRNHCSITVQFKEQYDASKRVTFDDGTISQRGRGSQCFIPHTSLNYNGGFNPCQYLKDDCLYFKFKISSASNKKPWLSSANAF